MLLNNHFLSRRSASLYLILFSLICLTIVVLNKVPRVLVHHKYDLDYETLFNTQIAVYILTHDCQRLTAEIAAHFDKPVTLVPDIHDSPHCAGLGEKLLLDPPNQATADDDYRYKYARVLEHCIQGEKIKCLLLEDDVVFLHKKQRNQEVIVENTLELFNGHLTTYDCTKRGFGWFSTSINGQGSQCRIFTKGGCGCVRDCITEEGDMWVHISRLDSRLRVCGKRCKLEQRRFLLVQHSGLTSAMQRGPPEVKAVEGAGAGAATSAAP